jgi:hypothetical protein
MTSQTKRFIEISDIVGVQFECKKCGVSVLIGGSAIPTAVDTYSEMLFECPTCKHPWTVTPGYPRHTGFDTEIKQFIRMLAEMNKLQERIGCYFRFEIKEEPVKQLASQK